MREISKIVFATDLWHDTPEMFDYVKMLQRKFNAKLWITHVLDSKNYFSYSSFVPFSMNSGVTEYLKIVKNEIGNNLNLLSKKFESDCTPILLTGNPRQELIKFTQETQADLIIMGAHSSSVPLFTLGSVSDYVVRHSPCPVFIVRKD